MCYNEDIIWVAGLLEGEGYFTAPIKQNKWAYFHIGCEMTDLDVLEKLRDKVGGRITKGRKRELKRKMSYTWFLSKKDEAYKLAMQLYPFMGKRRKAQINKCIKIYHTYRKQKYTYYYLRNIRTGEIEQGKNLTRFCRKHNLHQSNMYNVVMGKNKSCKGWIRCEN